MLNPTAGRQLEPLNVMPAKASIQQGFHETLDSRLRENDKNGWPDFGPSSTQLEGVGRLEFAFAMTPGFRMIAVSSGHDLEF
jgi:hypothetical protein